MKSIFAFVAITVVLFSTSACISLKMQSKKVAENTAPENNQIDYYLRKKVFAVEVGYTITEYKKYRITKSLTVTNNKTGNATTMQSSQQYNVALLSDAISPEFSLDDTYTITEILIKDPGQHFRLNFDPGTHGDFAKKKLTVNFDEATGLMTGINAEKTSIAPEIIKGSFSILAEVAKVATKALGFPPGMGDKGGAGKTENSSETSTYSYDSVAVSTTHYKETFLVDFDCATKQQLAIDLAKKVFTKNNPQLLFSLNCIKSCANDCKDSCPCSKEPNINIFYNGLVYRSPKPATFSMALSYDGTVQNIIQETVLMPQLGEINVLPINIEKAGKANISIELTKDGDVKTYTIDKESNIDAILNNTAEGIGGVSSSLQDLSDALKTKQTSKLTSQKEQLELQKEILQLQKDIEELKNGAAE